MGPHLLWHFAAEPFVKSGEVGVRSSQLYAFSEAFIRGAAVVYASSRVQACVNEMARTWGGWETEHASGKALPQSRRRVRRSPDAREALDGVKPT